MQGKVFADLLVKTLEPFLQQLKNEQLSSDYLTSTAKIVKQFATFCSAVPDGHPWYMREQYLEKRAELRKQEYFSRSYLENHGRELKRFLAWVMKRENKKLLGEPAQEVIATYLVDSETTLPYNKMILQKHVSSLIPILKLIINAHGHIQLESILLTHFELKRLALRADGYGYVMSNRAKVVTRNLLCWLEKQGHLPSGTAQGWVKKQTPKNEIEMIQSQVAADYYTTKIGQSLPSGLRDPLLAYTTHLTYEKMLTKKTIRRCFRHNLQLCQYLYQLRMTDFFHFRLKHAEAVIQSQLNMFVSDDLRLRRQKVRLLHGYMRGFLRFLFSKGYLKQDLAAGLISPPCYRYQKPCKVLTLEAVQSLLESIDRSSASGRRSYAIVMLIATYGLRPSDIARLTLDDIFWQARRISIVQSKTGAALNLPLVADVAQALYDYLNQDRPRDQNHRQLFLALSAPYLPLGANTVSLEVKTAMHAANLGHFSARTLRESVATHLLEQGEGISTVQEVLGHRSAETTQRYAHTSLKMMRQIFDEDEQ